MSTTVEDIKIDLDKIDAEKAKKDTKVANSETKVTDVETIEVKKVESEPITETRDVLTPDAGLEKLKKQLDDERIARADADRRAQEASDSELRARTEVQDTNLNLLTTAIASVKQSNEALKVQYREARAANDADAEFAVQEEMMKNAAKLVQLESGKSALEKAPKPTPRPVADPVEQFASRLTPQSAAWVRAHPDYVRDVQKNRQMLAAHEIALARGHQADTPGYFSSIEKTLDIAVDPAAASGAGTHIEVDPADDPMKDAAKPAAPQRRAAPAAAPVTRSGNGAGNRSNVVTLTPAEVEMAKLMFPESKNPSQEYALNKRDLQKEGKLN